MPKPPLLIFFLVSVLLIRNAGAQSFSSVHYDTKDGLPSATVYDISQDKQGFIWFATENGLSRFDGKNFRTFTTKDGLPDNSILKAHGDKSGRLYFTPFTHLLYYYQNDSFFKVSIPDKYKPDMSTISVLTNKGDTVLMAGMTNTYVLVGNSIASLHDIYNRVPEPVFLMNVFDTLIVAASKDSIYFIPDKGQIRSLPFTSDEQNVVVIDGNANKQILHFDKKEKLGLAGILTDNYMYGLVGKIMFIFQLSTGEPVEAIPVEKFSSAFFDNENNLWISTLGNGVYRYPSFAFSNMNFDGKSEVYSLIKAGGRIIAGTDFSKMYEMPIDSIRSYSTVDFSRFIPASQNTVAQTTQRNRIYATRTDRDDLYIGADAFLLRIKGNSAPVFRKIQPIKDLDIGDKEILVCTGQRVFLLDKHTLSIKDTLLRQRATAGVFYHGDYYIGTIGGLIKINAATRKETELYNQLSSFKGRITAIKKGNDDDLWIATSGSGLVHFKNERIIRVFKEQDGLTSDICTALYIDSTIVWLGTNNGLNRIETSNGNPAVTRFTSANGLGADFINSVLATDSNIYVGTAAGLTIFSKNILTEKSVCLLHILQVWENNKQLKNDTAYTFPYNALNIQVDFTAISFKSAGDITYYYHLEQLDNNWNTTRANFVNFPTLQPGSYTLVLKAVNKFGVQSETRRIRITILPPWWGTWIFRITALLVLGLLVLLIYRYNIRSFKRKEELKRDFETRFAALEQKALQAQMNPHFIFNSLNSIQTFILNLDVEGANNYLTNFANLIRQTLENSMQPLITVSSEIKYIETYLGLEKLRFRDKFRYNIEIDESIDQNNTLLPGMLLQPYIENSIRHGIQHRKDNNGFISLSLNKLPDGSVLYTISDNGVGRKRAEELKSSRHIEYQSRGTSINEKRIAAINNQFKTTIRVTIQDIFDPNGQVAGTSVTILIPFLHKNNL